jgi:CheY-like chemotaxis protein
VNLAREDDSTDDEETDAVDDEGPLAEFFAAAPDRLAEIRKVLPELGRAFDEDERKGTLLKLHELVCALKEKANCWDLRPVWQLTSALELLLKRLADKGKEATPSTIRTVASTMDLLAELCVPGVRPDLIINPPITVLAVDDDPLCLRAVLFALQKAEMTPDLAKNGEEALALAAEKSYDVVFMDIMMPIMDGLTACTKIHETPKNKTTPVVFVTARTDFRARTESTLVGGADLMAKPFLMFEITVKALAFAMRKRLELAESCRRDLAALDALSRAEGSAPSPRVSKSAAAPEPVAA